MKNNRIVNLMTKVNSLDISDRSKIQQKVVDGLKGDRDYSSREIIDWIYKFDMINDLGLDQEVWEVDENGRPLRPVSPEEIDNAKLYLDGNKND